ncbi:MAG: CPBP family intramembrane glutamic endopeptidase [bacterium]
MFKLLKLTKTTNFILGLYLVGITVILLTSVLGHGGTLIFGLKTVSWVLVLLFAVVQLSNFQNGFKADYIYFKPNQLNLVLNWAFFTPILILLYLIYTNKWNPQGDLTSQNLGIPNLAFPYYYAFISVPIQQSLIFGDLLKRLRTKFKPATTIGLTTAFYVLIHTFYPNPTHVMVGALVLGLIWSFITFKSKSIFGNLITHAVIGLIAIALNLA